MDEFLIMALKFKLAEMIIGLSIMTVAVTDMRRGRPAIIKVDENISIGGLKHEYRHFLDDIDNGNPGLGYYMQNPDEFFRLEKRGYEEELAIARESGYTDIEKKILKEVEQRRREIYGIK